MNVKIVNDNKYSWYCEKVDGVNIFFKGLLWYENKCFRNAQACKTLAEIFNIKNLNRSISLSVVTILKEKISKFRGHYSFILDGHDFVLAVVDKIRSFPIFYFNKGNSFSISNSAVELQTEFGLYENNKISFLEFEMAGYVTGSDTLFKFLSQLQAGEFLFFDKKSSNLEVVHHYRYWIDEIVENTEEELLDELHRATVKTFSDMVETLEGRPVWIPLSGGLDSRLVLTMLRELKYDNVSTFTYGIPGHWEIKQAKIMTDKLKVKWFYVPYKPKEIKKLYHTTERKKYSRFASGLSSLPFVSDFYALWILRNNKVISDDSIIINGQTGDYLTGGHIPKLIRGIEKDKPKVDILLKAIIDKHFSLWRNLNTEENDAIISEKILSLLQLTKDSEVTISEFARYFELHEWQERQSKYVINGQRMYEWLGYDWRLPLWSDELMAFWLKVSWEKKLSQRLYKKYLTQYNFAGVFDVEPPEQNTYMPLHVKVLAKILAMANRNTAKDTDSFIQKYLRYFMTYAPFYPQKSYFEYLKDSQWHRFYVSYLAKDHIAHL